jgi:hypothetical protein
LRDPAVKASSLPSISSNFGLTSRIGLALLVIPYTAPLPRVTLWRSRAKSDLRSSICAAMRCHGAAARIENLPK